jgi:hypothetical protein
MLALGILAGVACFAAGWLFARRPRVCRLSAPAGSTGVTTITLGAGWDDETSRQRAHRFAAAKFAAAGKKGHR